MITMSVILTIIYLFTIYNIKINSATKKFTPLNGSMFSYVYFVCFNITFIALAIGVILRYLP